ncbi:MAG: hypothetical protein BGP24_13475 [Lysobacterales bacterium 69-70]|nr:PH domain-containing protein [Xanthomonadaceae bacterium]ODU31186.1 MAG: hypothetical protein ABS97_23235 [Xanthomonadaceae bacterium SCN 69-320]ODV22669.1 MAG: hypothetical protein ABT27_00990 [Xanthomonadaceae bacterium SCN 69-25]OJY98775.1 MAG: hypothetical protein BGP24_13475 [Xanthomonadales bacterium 69-70]
MHTEGTPILATPRRFVTPTWIRLLCGLAAFATPAAAGILYAEQGLSWLTLASMAAALLAPLGLLDVLTARVELHPERLVVVANLRRREYPRSVIVRVSSSKGAGAGFEHADGRWIPLPSVAPSDQGVCRSIRSWLARGSAGQQEA